MKFFYWYALFSFFTFTETNVTLHYKNKYFINTALTQVKFNSTILTTVQTNLLLNYLLYWLGDLLCQDSTTVFFICSLPNDMENKIMSQTIVKKCQVITDLSIKNQSRGGKVPLFQFESSS